MRRTLQRSMLLALWLAGAASYLVANNGAIAYIYPLSNLTIDGNLDDWPADIQVHSMSFIHYGGGIDGPEDAEASWRAGYDPVQGVLYFGVTMADDDYVKTPDNNHYSSHDFQVLYLDPTHSPDGAGVIAFELDEDHRKIVEQEQLSFYPQVRNANFDQVEMQIDRKGRVVTYEWKIQISGDLEAGRVIGFDYAVFDKDTEQNHVMITWGPGGMKFLNTNRIGDLVLAEPGSQPAQVNGNLTWKGPASEEWPGVIRFSNQDNPQWFFCTLIDSLGHYSLSLPAGEYEVNIPTSRQRIEWNEIDLVSAANEPQRISVRARQELTLDLIEVAKVPKPDLISEAGLLLQSFNSNSAERVDEFVAAYQAHFNIPGVSLALIQEGEMVYHQTYGVENARTDSPLRAEAVFEAASITKLVFAYVMNRLVQRGEFDLDKPLHETVTFPELEEDFPEYKSMTGRHVLTHVSGLPNWGAEMINEPGTTYGYSGEGFEYLKKVLAGGVSDDLPGIIQAHLEREVLDPLKMSNTYFMCNDQLPDLKVAGHFDGVPNPYDCPDWPGMAFSMHTEAKDFVPFALALLNRDGLTEEQAEEMFSFHTLYDEEDWTNGYKSGFGLGVALRESPHGLVFGHGGNNGDFRCSFEIYDELGTGFIVFTNADTAEPFLYDLMYFLVEGKK